MTNRLRAVRPPAPTFHPILDAEGQVWICPCTVSDHRGRMKVDGDRAIRSPAELRAFWKGWRGAGGGDLPEPQAPGTPA